ncbi:MAG TPA: hypothetical protein VKZ41_09795 [Gemmatimonadales bacterium]|nr:hypothetical protein [Gemmatimonadales bacterium]
MRPFAAAFMLFVAAILPLACGSNEPDDDDWVSVFGDENYTVSFAPDRLELQAGGWYSVWYRTQHQRPRIHGEQAWNTETVRSLLRCDGLWFKIAEVRLTNNRRVVSRQRASKDELELQRWRLVARGTSEEDIARMVCEHAGSP